jgi:hypothetical protein
VSAGEQALAVGGLVPFFEHQVERAQHAIEPEREVLAFGQVEPDAGIGDALLGPGELLFQRGLAAEERPGDFRGAFSRRAV